MANRETSKMREIIGFTFEHGKYFINIKSSGLPFSYPVDFIYEVKLTRFETASIVYITWNDGSTSMFSVDNAIWEHISLLLSRTI